MNAPVLRHRPGHRAVSLLLLLTLALTSLSPVTPAAAGPRRTAPQRSDGERLFRAIFFLEGPMADEIPELRRLKSMEAFRKLTPRQEQAVRSFQTRLVRELATANPSLFPDFEKALQSGDRARISRALGDASQAAKDVLRERDPAARRFLDRYEATLIREFRSSMRDGRQTGPPDLKALQRAVPKAAAQEAERTELVWLKGFKAGGPAASEPQQPDTDHSIAIVLLTFVALFVIVVVALPIVAADGGSDLYHDRLVNSLATRVEPR